MSLKINIQKESGTNAVTKSVVVGSGKAITPTGSGIIEATNLLGTIDASQVSTGTLDPARLPLGLGTDTTPANGKLLIGNGVGYTAANLTAGTNISITNTAGGIQINNTMPSGLIYQGAWNALTNTPTLTSSVGTQGYYYVVSVAGTTNLNGVTDWQIGDWAIFNGSVWQKIDNSDQVTSVFGRQGAVAAASGDYTASQVTNVPYAGIVATDVQAAINELYDDIQASQQVLTAYVTNAESFSITRGQVVYLYGAQGNRASVKLASNLSDATSAKTFGVVADASIAAGQAGYIRCQGVVDNLNLGAYNPGDTLYLGATPGSLTATKPYAPNHLVYVGIVERANNGNGQLYVKIQNGYELDEIHDVQITAPRLAGQTLLYDQTDALWKNARLTAGTGMTLTFADASVTLTPNFAAPPVIGNTTPNVVNATTLNATDVAATNGTFLTSVTTPYVKADTGVYLTLAGGSSGASLVLGLGASGQATFDRKLNLTASTTTAASLNIPQGTAPTTPTNGDIWTTTAGLYARINGTTVGPFGTGTVTSVSGTANQVTVSPTTGDVVVSLPTAITNVNSITASSATNLTLNGGSSGASIVAGQGTNANITLTPTGTGSVTTPGILKTTNTTASTSTTSGALQVAGGVGIAGALYTGGNLNVSGTGTNTFSGPLAITNPSTTLTTISNPSYYHLALQTTGAGVEREPALYFQDSGTFLGGVEFGAASGTAIRVNAMAFRNLQNGAFLWFQGSTVSAPSMLLNASANLLLGTTTDSSNGKLQLATHTTSAGGIGFGTDLSLFRASSTKLQIFNASQPQLGFTDSTREYGRLETAGGSFYISSTYATSDLVLRSGNATTALTLDSSQNATFAGTISRNGAAGNYRVYNVQSSGVSRWAWGADNAAESGSNAGSDFVLYSFTDAGSVLTNPVFKLTRSTGDAAFSGASTFGNYVTVDGTSGAAFRARKSNNTSGAQSWNSSLDTSGTWSFQCANDNFVGANTAITLTRSGTTPTGLTINATTASSSTTTGALIVSGGVGMAGALYTGGSLTSSGTSTNSFAGQIYNTATGGGLNGQFRGFNSSASGTNGALSGANFVAQPGYSTFIGTTADGTAASYQGAALGSVVQDQQGYVISDAARGLLLHSINGNLLFATGNTGTRRGTWSSTSLTVENTTDSSSTTTGALVVSGGLGLAKKLYVGGNAIYMTGAGDQAIYTNSTQTLFLGVQGVGVIKINGADGAVSTAFPVTISNATASTSTTTGALVVSGGVGVAGAVYAGGAIADLIGNVRSIPQNSQTGAYALAVTDNGKHISITTGGITVNSGIFSAGQVVVIFNNSGSSQTITQGTSVTMYLGGVGTTGNRTLAGYGVATVMCVASNTFVITGSGLT